MKIRKEFIVGIFSTAGIVALILGFFYLKGQSFFGEREEYYAVYDNADGFTEGSAIKLDGVQVGKVTAVELHPKIVGKTLITFEITNDRVQMPIGTVAQMKGDLLGSVSINLLYPDSVVKSFHLNHDTLLSDVAEDLTATINAKVDPLIGKVNELMLTVDGAIKTIDGVFDANTGKVNETFDKLNKSMTHFYSISRNVDSLTHVLNHSKHMITSTLANINSITANLKASNEEITATIKNINTVSGNLAKVDIQPILAKADNALSNVNLILDQIQNGDGTLTKLMQDSLLYDNINLMLNEATMLINNITTHPNRYLQFAIFGGKDKGMNLPGYDEKRLKTFTQDSLRKWYP
ncbi:MAG: MCE family protein [Flavobacteriales bacterium]|nr:MCE family protein [Flavobacteriales bacterium]